MYSSNANLPDGFMGYVKGNLIYRPKSNEKTYQHFAEIIDTETLKVSTNIIYNIFLEI